MFIYMFCELEQPSLDHCFLCSFMYESTVVLKESCLCLFLRLWSARPTLSDCQIPDPADNICTRQLESQQATTFPVLIVIRFTLYYWVVQNPKPFLGARFITL